MGQKHDVDYWTRIVGIRRESMLKATREYEEALGHLELARALAKPRAKVKPLNQSVKVAPG